MKFLLRLFAKKSVKELQKEASSSHDLERSLNAWELILLGIGGVVGAGIFVLAGNAAGNYAGPAITISFILCGFACICAGLCYAELASTIPVSGSSYTYTYATMGEFMAWIIAGMNVLTFMLGGAVVASGWSSYVMDFLRDFGIYILPTLSDSYGQIVTLENGTELMTFFDLPAFLLVTALAAMLYRSTEGSALLNAVITTIKMLSLLGFVVVGMFFISTENWTPYIPSNTGTFGEFGISGIMSGAAVVFLAFTAFDSVAAAAQETKNPQRDVPIGIIGALAVATFTYVLVAAVLTGVVNYKELGGSTGMAIAANIINMPWFSLMLKVGIICGLTTVVLVQMYTAIRIMYAVTKDGLLPDFLAKVHKKFHTPHVLTVVIALLTGLISAIFPINKVVQMCNLATLITFLTVCIGTLYLRYKSPELKRPFKCPLVPVVPLIAIGLFVSIIVGIDVQTFKYMAFWLVGMVAVYFIFSIRNSHLQQRLG